MATLTIRELAQALRRRRGAEGHRPRGGDRRIHRARRPVGLRQVDAAGDDRRAGDASPKARSASTAGSSTPSPPKDRDIAMVFQSYALYPTMTARQNITFGMESRGVPKAEQDEAVKRVASLLQIEPLLAPQARPALRRPAPARRDGPRAGARSQAVPVRRAALQSRRQAARRHAHRDQEAAPAASARRPIYVTHDQIEAMTLATRIAVMHQGAIQQFDEPQSIYDRPANMFVAGFMGSPSMNFIPGRTRPKSDGRPAVAIALDGGGDGDAAAAPMRRSAGRATAASCSACGRNICSATTPSLKARKPALAALTAPVEVVEPTGAETHRGAEARRARNRRPLRSRRRAAPRRNTCRSAIDMAQRLPVRSRRPKP